MRMQIMLILNLFAFSVTVHYSSAITQPVMLLMADPRAYQAHGT